MTGGKSRPKKDKAVKVSNGQSVKRGQILVRGISSYKAGKNVEGLDPIFSICEGKVYFSKKKSPGGKVRTYANVTPT